MNQENIGGGGGGWFHYGIPSFAKNYFTDTAVWGLTLSCKKNQLPLSLLSEVFEPMNAILPHNIPY
jgi:hypothetical protein